MRRRLRAAAIGKIGNHALRALRAGGFRLRGQLGQEGFDRLMAFSDRVDELHAGHLPVPHTYLFFIGVNPAHQGKGYAAKLIRPMPDRLDARQMPCYLNTQNERNVGLYEHFGFRVVDRQVIPGSSIVHTAMVRTRGRDRDRIGWAGTRPPVERVVRHRRIAAGPECCPPATGEDQGFMDPGLPD